jgi:hypothetical protein
MTGLERSSDIDLQSERLTSLQEMRTSYLPHPLLGHVNGSQWTPNLIGFE